MDWHTTLAAIWRPAAGRLRAVRHLDPITFEDLLGIDVQAKNCSKTRSDFYPGNHAITCCFGVVEARANRRW